MAKYKFIKLPDDHNRFDLATVEHSFQTENLTDILEEFTNFLTGAGFVIDKTKESIVLYKEEEREDGSISSEVFGEQEEFVGIDDLELGKEKIEDYLDTPAKSSE